MLASHHAQLWADVKPLLARFRALSVRNEKNHPHSLRMILAADNKGYLCRPLQVGICREFCSKTAGTAHRHRLGAQQGSLLFDCEALGLCGAWKGADHTFVGLDTHIQHRANEQVTLSSAIIPS